MDIDLYANLQLITQNDLSYFYSNIPSNNNYLIQNKITIDTWIIYDHIPNKKYYLLNHNFFDVLSNSDNLLSTLIMIESILYFKKFNYRYFDYTLNNKKLLDYINDYILDKYINKLCQYMINLSDVEVSELFNILYERIDYQVYKNIKFEYEINELKNDIKNIKLKSEFNNDYINYAEKLFNSF